MEKIAPAVYAQINNEVYKSPGDIWWKPDSVLHLLKTSVNPWRVGFAKRIIAELNIEPQGKTALEVGCGGGILTEEICKMGFRTSGIDPAEESLNTARNHAESEGLSIHYEIGSGEDIPYSDASLDFVFCCDVLEHVSDLPKVISEISRVLKPEGVFIYDTLNRTFVSKIVAIKIWQQWNRWSFMPANLHVWKMFIKPEEIRKLLLENGFQWKEHIGSKPNVSIPTMLNYLRKRKTGQWTYVELGENFRLIEDKDMNILYGGYAIKR
jgi:2-polyprenyl-6-hydroxyphenyl methylase / 3-demethylubiquinone-9 3-methyltransferase